MPHASFVHLRTHTAYSLSEGAIKIKQLTKLCEKYGMPAVAMTDTGNLFGALEFSTACADSGIQPIIGVQVAVRRLDEGQKGGIGRELKKPEPDQLVLLCQNETGYAHALKLVSKAFLETESGETPQITYDDLAQWNEGLICLTGGILGPVGRLLGEDNTSFAEKILCKLAKIFDGRLYMELQRHGLPIEDQVEPLAIGLAYQYDVPLVATNEPFFTDASMYEAHDALLCIASGAYVSQQDRRRLTPEHRFKSADEMRELFSDLPEAIDNTLVVARRCAYMVAKRKPILPPFDTPRGEVEELRLQSREGLEQRLQIHVFTPDMDEHARERAAKPYRERLDYELGIIEQMGFPGYFLIVSDFIKWAKANGCPVGPGRGSGAGSAVAWALSITDLDPLRWGLLFERFLNPERVSMPDFDVDFCQDNRERVIHYVQQKYGYHQVAQIITFGKLQARAVLRDVGRVLQLPYGQVDRISKLVPNNPADPCTLEQALEKEPQLKEMQQSDETVAHLLDLGMKLEGLYRHASTHAAGVVIGDRPLDALVPLYRDPRSDMPVTQFNMKWVEAAGLVKFDFLGLKTLTVIEKAVEFIRRRGVEVDMAALPLDDKPTFELLTRGDTAGVFQLESTGMRNVLRTMRPDTFEDIIAVVALYRPGPMDNIPTYIKRKHGEEEPDYLHPRLEGILKETFGIMIYQEQVMQIAQELSGYSLGGADLLRRAMGKKIKEEMDAQRKLFVDGATARGVDASKASEIFDQVNKFAGYGFNKSHAAAYALVSYQTAWLKANYPVEFMAASMTYEMSNTDKLGAFRQELDRLKVRLLPPDVNKSFPEFNVEPLEDGSLAVRYALAALRNVGAQAMADLVAERERKGPYKDISDFAGRIDAKTLNRRQMENLVKAGAFDSVHPNRAQLFTHADTVLKHAQMAAEERNSAQVSLFGGAGAKPEPIKMPATPEWPVTEKLAYELESIGFYLTAHPMDAYAKALARIGVLKISEVMMHLKSGGKGRIKLAGMLEDKQERISARGSRFAFVRCSDASGSFEAMMFSETLLACRDMLEKGRPLLLTCDARIDEEALRLTCQGVESLDEAASKATAGLKIVIRDDSALKPLQEAIRKEGKGRGQIVITAEAEGRAVDLRLADKLALSPALINAVRSMPGIADVQEL